MHCVDSAQPRIRTVWFKLNSTHIGRLKEVQPLQKVIADAISPLNIEHVHFLLNWLQLDKHRLATQAVTRDHYSAVYVVRL